MNRFIMFVGFLFAVVFSSGCYGSQADDGMVTYTVTFDTTRWLAKSIAVARCDETGYCSYLEPECRIDDTEPGRGTLEGISCDFVVNENEMFSFNIQRELRIFELPGDAILSDVCRMEPELQENQGEVHLFRDGIEVDVTKLSFGSYAQSFCNFAAPPAS